MNDNDFLTTDKPFDFVDKKVSEFGIDALSSLEKAYYYFGRMLEVI